MYQGGQFVGQDLLGGIELGALPLVHLVDLLEGQEGHHAQALENVSVADVSPVLVEIVGGGLVGVEPDCSLGGLAHLLALGVEQQGDGHGMCVLAELLADQLCTCQHVAPLVIAAELHIAAVFLIQAQEIICLHDHVIELKEGEALLHSLLVASGAEHVVDREVHTDITDKLDVVEVAQPVCIVDHQRLVGSELDKAAHLLFEALAVVVDHFDCHHGTQILSA